MQSVKESLRGLVKKCGELAAKVRQRLKLLFSRLKPRKGD